MGKSSRTRQKFRNATRADPASPVRCPKPHTVRRSEGMKSKNRVKSNISALADESFHFAAEHEEHVHFDREPEQHAGGMHERVGGEAPDLTRSQDACAIEKHEDRAAAPPPAATSRQVTNGDHDVQGDENGRDVDRKPAHPGDWPIVIGGSDSEHISIIAFAFMSARAQRDRVMNSPRQRRIGHSARDAEI